MDPRQIRRLMRAYRAARFARKVKRGHRKAKRMLEAYTAQTDLLLDAALLAGRIREDRVQPEDVRNGARVIVNATPTIYRFVARHIRKSRLHAKA